MFSFRECKMKDNFHVIKILILVSLITLCGCTEVNNEKQDTDGTLIDVPLNEIALTENDVPSSFALYNENHTTEPSVQFNETGHGITWNILERYDAMFYANLSNGVMQSLLKLDTAEAAQNLTVLTYNNLLEINYTKQNIDEIGDTSFLVYSMFPYENESITYYTLFFTYGNIFVALGGSVPEVSTFIGYAELIESRIDTFIQENESIE